jgi:hypothetical protein
VFVCVLRLLSVFDLCNIVLCTAIVPLHNLCFADRPACCSLLVGNYVYGGPDCNEWGLQQYCLFILCWIVLMHFFVSNPGLPELTAVIWAACVLC